MRFEIKLTDLGRKRLAEGTLDFKWYALGDSEVQYGATGETLPVFVQNSKITSHLQETIGCNKIFALTGDCEVTTRRYLGEKSISIYDNPILGIGKTSDYFSLTGTTLPQFDGTCFFDVSGTTGFDSIEDGDFILIKINNDTFDQPLGHPVYAMPYLVYSVTKVGLSTTLKLDRNLPYLYTSGETEWAIIPKNASYLGASPEDSIDFNYFDSCGVCSGSTLPYVGMTNLYCDVPLMGLTGCTETTGYPSGVGVMRYLGYCGDCDESLVPLTDCKDVLNGVYDTRVDSIVLLRLDIVQDYIFIDQDNPFSVHFPTLMYHRRYFDYAQGDLMGMSFRADLTKKTTTQGLTYYDLLEDSDYVQGDPRIVGRVYVDHKLVVFHDPEIVTACGYFSNRNWTLPALAGKMVYPMNGIGTGILPKGKTLYMTYELEATTGITHTYAQQRLLKFVNTTNIDRDISFTIEEAGLLRYMRKLEMGYDGLGFYAHKFNLLYQIVDSQQDRPLYDGWKKINFTTNNITTNPYESIDPLKLERQEPELNQFLLTQNREDLAGYTYYGFGGCDCGVIGKEWLFLGGAVFSAGTSLFRRSYKIDIGTNISATDNVSYSSGNLILSEISILDSNLEDVVFCKVSPPLEILGGTQIELELDF